VGVRISTFPEIMQNVHFKTL